MSLPGLTRETVLRAAESFTEKRKKVAWTVFIDGEEYPLRELAVRALDVRSGSMKDIGQAARHLQKLGFIIHFKGQLRLKV